MTYNTRRGGIARAVREVDILGKSDTFTHIFMQEVTRIDGGGGWLTQSKTTHEGHGCFWNPVASYDTATLIHKDIMADANNFKVDGERHWLAVGYELNGNTFLTIHVHMPTSWDDENNFIDILMHIGDYINQKRSAAIGRLIIILAGDMNIGWPAMDSVGDTLWATAKEFPKASALMELITMTGLRAPTYTPKEDINMQWTYKGRNNKNPRAFGQIYMSQNYTFNGVYSRKKHIMKQSDHRPVCATSEEQTPFLRKFVRQRPPSL